MVKVEKKEIEAPKVVYKKSEVLKEHKEVSEANDKLIKVSQETEYEITLKNKKIFDRLIKFLEKDAPWGHTTATGLIMLFNNMAEQRKVTQDKDWNGILKLRSASISILWTMITKMTGAGFYEARTFVELMAICGESLSKAVQTVSESHTAIRELHQRLATLDDLIDNPDTINDVEETEETTKSLAEEVDPIVEA